MMGRVFQVNGEQRKRGQFKDTLDMMKIYTSKNMPKKMDILSCIFNDDITEPEVKEPEEPVVKTGKGEITKGQLSIYNARINLYIKEERSFKSAIIVLYNVTCVSL